MAAATPGAMHEKLAYFAGKWNCEVTSHHGGNTETTKGTMVGESMYGGRFVFSKFEGTMMNMPFQGTSVMGYNNASKQFESLWFDSMSTGMMMSMGTMDAAGKKMNFSGETMCPLENKLKTCREVTTITSPDSYTMEFYHPNAEGKEELGMQINFSRVK